MSDRRDRRERIDLDFYNELCDIKRQRIIRGLDKPTQPISSRRITRGIIRDSNWKVFKDKLITMPRDFNLDRKMNRRGGVFDIFLWIVIGFAVIFVGGAVLYASGLITSAVTSIPVTDGTTSALSNATQITFGTGNTILQSMRYWSFILFIAIALSILVSNFLVRVHPIFFFLYVLLMIVFVVFSIYISNTYENVVNNAGALQATYHSFTGMGFIMLHLPVFVTVLGFLGGLVMFIGLNRDQEAGGGFVG